MDRTVTKYAICIGYAAVLVIAANGMRIDNRREKITPPHFEDAGGVKREFRQ